MNSNICNICGANYEYRNGRWVCPACDAVKPEEITNEETTLLYVATQERQLMNFDEAERKYSDIIERYPKKAESYFGRVLSKYGIKYEKDYDGRNIPTCCATSLDSFLDDKDYLKALELADKENKRVYQEHAEYIEKIRAEWIEKAKKEEPYDVFISYKESEGLRRTEDSIAVQDLYIHLTEQGYRVFFSRESLRDKTGQNYEPYIFSALSTAKVMLVYASKPEYVMSIWLKNEWTRYIKRIKLGEKRDDSLLVACDGFSPNELPSVLAKKQCLDAKARSFYTDLDNRIKELVKNAKVERGFVRKYKVEKINVEELVPAKKQEIKQFNTLHEHNFKKVQVVPPTCNAQGYTLYRCECGEEKKADFTPKRSSHEWQLAERKEPTCINNGYELFECKYCDATDKKILTATGHDEFVAEEKDSTCFEEGYRKYECKVCGHTRFESIDKIDHEYGDWVITKHPTCVENGEETRQCKNCPKQQKRELSATGHSFSKWVVKTEPTCNNEGVEHRQCKTCGKIEERKLPKREHKFDVWKNSKDGKYKERICEYCGHVERILTEDYKKIRKKRIVKLSTFIISFLIIITTIISLIVYNTITLPNANFDKATELFNAGKYGEAMAIYKDLDGFGNSANKISIIEAINTVEDGEYEEGIKKMLENGATVTVSYNCNGGELKTTNTMSLLSSNGAALMSATEEIDENIFTYKNLNEFEGFKLSTRNGYVFSNWALVKCTPTITKDSNKIELNFIAEWSAKSYTITYDLDGGSVDGENVIGYNSDDAEITLINPTRTGYTFKGWTGTDLTDKTMKVTIPSGSYGNRSYTANWQANLNTLKFEGNGATSGYMEEIKIETDELIMLPICNYVREGYLFAGWSSVKDGDVEYPSRDLYRMGTNPEYILYPIWIANTNILKFDGNGATFGQMQDVEIKTNDSIILPANNFERDGYQFAGWSLTKEGDSEYSSTDLYKMGVNAESVLYAVWVQNSLIFTQISDGYSVKYNGNDSNLIIPSKYMGCPVTKIFEVSGRYTLQEITIPGSIKVIGGYAFEHCNALTTVNYLGTIEQWAQISFEVYAHDDYNCHTNPMDKASVFKINGKEITEIELGNITAISAFAFYGFNNLTKITISDSVKIIGEEAFKYCSSLTTVEFASNSQLTVIDQYAFENCYALEKFELPERLVTIGQEAFRGCGKLKKIVLPSDVTEVGKWAFYGCWDLTVYCEAISKPSGWDKEWDKLEYISKINVVWAYNGE